MEAEAGRRSRLNAWVHACFDGSMARDRPVAWSRQNLVAYGAVHDGAACVVVVPSECVGCAVDDPVATHLHPPTRGPLFAADRQAPCDLDAPALVSFSPCGYTLMAFFSVSPILATSDASALPSEPVRTRPLTPAFAESKGTESPALTPPVSMPHTYSQPISDATDLLPYDHGVICIWTRAPGASIAAWSLKQWIPVSPVPSFTHLSGHIIGLHWLDHGRMWKGTESGASYMRAPSCGPATNVPPAGLPTDMMASEQACILISHVGHVVFVHRANEHAPFRMHVGWLHVPGIYPLPTHYEPTTLHKMFTTLDIRHMSITALPNEPILFVAYQCYAHGSVMFMHVSELTFDLHGELSCFIVNPEPPLTMRSPQDSICGTSHAYLMLTAMTWSCLLDGSLVLVFALATDESSFDPLSSSTSLCNTSLYIWNVRRSQSRRMDELRCIFESLPDPSRAVDDAYRAWRITVRSVEHIPGMVISSLLPESSPLPYAGRIYATAFDIPNMGREVWAVLDTQTFAWSVLDQSMPEQALMRSAMALSPCGVLACMCLGPSRPLRMVPLPVSRADVPSLGALFALSLLRNASPMDVAMYARTHHELSPAMIADVVHATEHALGYDPHSLAQSVRLCPMVEALATCSAHLCLQQRAHTLSQLAQMHHTLCAARTDATCARLDEIHAAGATSASFAAASVWRLAHVLRTLVRLLERVLHTAMHGTAAGARPADVRSDAVLDLVLHAPTSRMVHDIVAGACVFAHWITHMSPRAWLHELVPAHDRATPLKCEQALTTLANVQAFVSDTLHGTPIDVPCVLALFDAPAQPHEPACWDAWMHAPQPTLSDAAWERAQHVRHLHAIRDPLALARLYTPPLDVRETP